MDDITPATRLDETVTAERIDRAAAAGLRAELDARSNGNCGGG